MYNIENFLSENILGENITCNRIICYGKSWWYTIIIAELLYLCIYILYIFIGLFLLKNIVKRSYIESIIYLIWLIVWIEQYNVYFKIK